MNYRNIKKYAFTLAETLVTLSIIGIVMALMLRAVNRVSPNKDKLLFLKSYRAVEQAIEESINDQSKYDQATYTDNPRPTDLHEDFRDAPYSDYVSPSCPKAEGQSLSREEAVCCFLADNINTIGAVNCANNTGPNFTSSNGVIFGNWYGVSSTGEITGYVQTDPNDDTKRYEITVSHNGKVSVPAGSTQETWMRNQTNLR